MLELNFILEECVKLARKAGQAILEVAQSSDLNIRKKADKSVVTRADMYAHEIINNGLMHLTPDIPIISEEGVDIPAAIRLPWERCWLVDPLDGTRGFVNGSGEYTVNIALIENHKPILGVIYAPQLNGKMYAALHPYVKSRVRAASTAVQLPRPLRIAMSQYHGSHGFEDLLLQLTEYVLVRANSSIKFGMIADGQVDIYLRIGPTSEWDTAAGQCIVAASGGLVVDLEGETLQYNGRDTLTNPSFLVVRDPNFLDPFLNLMKRIKGEQSE